MLFSKSLIAVASFVTYVSANYNSSPESSVKVHVIQAKNGDGGVPIFEPAEVQAAVGDLIQFQFHPVNHSVVQASFADPCVPIGDSPAGNGTEGFFSGFMPVKPEDTVMPTFTIPVTNERPIWFYCSQGRHCQAGMVGVINPTAERTLADFKNRAGSAAANLSPGQKPEGDKVSSGVPAGPTNAPPTYEPPTPTTIQTTRTGGATTTNTAPPIATGAASKLGSSAPLLLAAVAASFFFL